MAPLVGAGQPPSTLPRWPWALLALLLAGVIVSGLTWRPSDPVGGAASLPVEVFAEVPDFALTDQEGRPVRRADLAGRVWVAGFIFTRCGSVCPVVTERMAALQRPGLDLVSFTVDPDYDTPGVLKEYARRHVAGASWRFLTGPRETLYRLIGRGFRLSVSAMPEGAPEHSDRLVLVDRHGRIRGAYSSGDLPAMARLRRDLEAVLAEP